MAKIMFYTFANTLFFFKEVKKNLEKRNIESKFILPRGTYLNKLNLNEYFYLYENFNEVLNKVEKVKFNLKKDNIYKIIECDKNEIYSSIKSYKSLDKEFQLKLAYTIYSIYKKFLLDYKPDYVIFPDVETVDGNILINLCYELGIEVIYTVHLRQLGTSFFSNSIYETLPKYFGKYEKKDIEKATFIVDNFISISSINFLRDYQNLEKIKIEIEPFFKRILKFFNSKEKYFYGEGKTFSHRILMNLGKQLEKFNNFKFDTLHHKYFDIRNDNELNKLPKNFILFAMQVTPESSINSLEPYFIDQLRAIDLIRLNMPNNFYVVVKEHPSMKGFRNSNYYKMLRKKAGIILVSPYVNTKEVMKRAKIISTITGTIGLESFMMNKPTLMFGPTFFSHLVKRFDSYLNLKEDIENLIYNFKPLSREKKIIEIAKLYNISYKFMLFDPIANPEVMEKENIKSFANALLDHIKRLENV